MIWANLNLYNLRILPYKFEPFCFMLFEKIFLYFFFQFSNLLTKKKLKKQKNTHTHKKKENHEGHDLNKLESALPQNASTHKLKNFSALIVFF